MIPSRRKPHVEQCLNCGTPTPDAFCGHCGQEAVDASVSFGDQVADVASEVLTVESRLPQTLAALVRRPGELTRAYNAGHRVRYLAPLRLYLFASVLFFLLLSILSSHAGPVVTVGPDGKTIHDVAEMDAVLRQTGSSIPVFMQAGLRRLILSPEGFLAALADTISKATMALVPVHALLLKLVYRRPRRLYGEHVVFSLHVHAFAYLVLAAATVLGLPMSEDASTSVSSLGVVWIGVYLVLAARRAYGEGAVRSTVKTLVVAAGYLLALALVMMLASGIAVLRIG